MSGDEREIASAFLRQNKSERKIKTQEKIDFSVDVNANVQESYVEYIKFNQMPERTPEEINSKQQAYRRFESETYKMRLQQLADAELTQFFIPKTTATKDRLLTDAEYRKELKHNIKALAGIQNYKFAYSSRIAIENKFFHWSLEFPEVFQNGGFDCILGNPPFLGGQKLSGSFGDPFFECIKYQFAPIGAVDLVTYFFRRNFTLIKQGGFQSLISTNTIAQGSAREDGLDVIVKQGGTINHAVKSMKWPGMAAVEVALVTITKQTWKGKFILAGKDVKTITPYLDDADTVGNPYT